MTAEVLDLISELRHEGFDYRHAQYGLCKEVSDRCVFVAEGQALEEGPSEVVFENPQSPALEAFSPAYCVTVAMSMTKRSSIDAGETGNDVVDAPRPVSADADFDSDGM